MEEFTQNVTAHGISKVIYLSKERSVRRWVWIALILGALVALGIIVYQRVVKFMENPTSTVVVWEQELPIPFPAVTVCNENGFQRSRVQQYGLQTLNNSVLKQMTQPVDQMVLRCEFAGEECFAANMTVSLDATYGACYTFNGLQPTVVGSSTFHPRTNPLVSTRTGRDYGLRLILDIEQAEYVGFSPRVQVQQQEPGAQPPASTARPPPDNRNSTVQALFEGPEAAGIRVIIHSPDSDPNPSLGIGVGPGTAVDLAFARVDRSRLYPPFGTCQESWHSDSAGADPLGYTKSSCERDCYYESVADTCDCLLLPWPASLADRPLQYVCSKSEATCIEAQLTKFQNGALGCSAKCPDRCRESQFGAQVGTQAWPSTASAETILSIIRTSKDDQNVRADYLAANMMSVRVFPPTAEFQTVTTVKAYTFDSLVSDVGGNTGLWAGMSMLTVVEILEFVLLLIGACACGSCCMRKKADIAYVVDGAAAAVADGVLASAASVKDPTRTLGSGEATDGGHGSRRAGLPAQAWK